MEQPAKQPVGRPPTKQRLIVDHLRQRIIHGDLRPADRLPTRRDLAVTFDASPVTVQQALDHLIRSGFVESKGSRGTFVVPNPPHLTHYAIVFPALPDSLEWRRFWTALANECQRIHGDTNQPRTISVWYGIDGHPAREDYHRLVADVRAHRLAGLIFATVPWHIRDTPLVEEPGIARVAIMGKTLDMPGIPRVEIGGSFLQKALASLAEQGRRKVAILIPPGIAQDATWIANYDRAIERHGMESRPYWRIEVNQSTPQTARTCTHLLMRLPKEDRPDALIVTDDNLVEQTTAGLIDAGAQVPRDIAVVAHCNFPWPTPSAVPVNRLGYDARTVVKACIDIIDAQRRGETPPHVTVIDAVFEHETSHHPAGV